MECMFDCLRPFCSSQSIPSTTQGGTLDHQQTPQLVDDVPTTVGNVPNDTELKHEDSKLETPLLPEGQHKPAILSVPNYSYGFVLPSPMSQLVQMEGHEAQARDASLISNFAVRPRPTSVCSVHLPCFFQSMFFLTILTFQLSFSFFFYFCWCQLTWIICMLHGIILFETFVGFFGDLSLCGIKNCSSLKISDIAIRMQYHN